MNDIKQAIEAARKLVAAMPIWKRNTLEQSGKPTVSIPRKPIMRLGLFIIAAIFATALYFGEPSKASTRQASCSGAALCSGVSASCAGASRQPVRGVAKRLLLGVRPVRRLLSRGCNG